VLGQPIDLETREEPRGDLVMRVLTATARAYQYVVTDCGSSLDEASVTAATVADQIVLITTPDIPSVKDTWRRLQFLDKLGLEKERIRLVVNRLDRRTAQVATADIEQNLSRKVDAVIHEDARVLRAIAEGVMLRDIDKKCEGARDIGRLVGLITGEEAVDEPKPGGFMNRLFGR
jgi:pilus assembly protein CpaE